jgi:hypothetical protein
MQLRERRLSPAGRAQRPRSGRTKTTGLELIVLGSMQPPEDSTRAGQLALRSTRFLRPKVGRTYRVFKIHYV